VRFVFLFEVTTASSNRHIGTLHYHTIISQQSTSSSVLNSAKTPSIVLLCPDPNPVAYAD